MKMKTWRWGSKELRTWKVRWRKRCVDGNYSIQILFCKLTFVQKMGFSAPRPFHSFTPEGLLSEYAELWSQTLETHNQKLIVGALVSLWIAIAKWWHDRRWSLSCAINTLSRDVLEVVHHEKQNFGLDGMAFCTYKAFLMFLKHCI